MRKRGLQTVIVTALLIALCLLWGLRGHAPPKEDTPTTTQKHAFPTKGTVTKVHDGDTITLKANGAEFRCRLLGLDTPEMSYSQLRSQMDKVSKYMPAPERQALHETGETFRQSARVMEKRAREARAVLARMVEGRAVALSYDRREPKVDTYGRLLVYVNADGVDVNAEMITLGFAVADTRFSCDRLDSYVKLWRAAQEAGVGLWAREAERSGR
jgi:endonuclease YncB( thermonuclease family)